MPNAKSAHATGEEAFLWFVGWLTQGNVLFVTACLVRLFLWICRNSFVSMRASVEAAKLLEKLANCAPAKVAEEFRLAAHKIEERSNRLKQAEIQSLSMANQANINNGLQSVVRFCRNIDHKIDDHLDALAQKRDRATSSWLL